MSMEERPCLLVSRCLGFADCRWDGTTVESHFVNLLEPYVRFITVCPEVEIGLGVPRNPVRIVLEGETRHLIQPSSGRNLTGLMNHFAEKFLSGIDPVDGVILKSRSPSCGLRDTKWYADGTADSAFTRGAGLFGRAVREQFPHLAVDDEKRVEYSRSKEHFLIRIFSRCRFRNLKKDASVAGLVNFHERNKLLFMAFHQKKMRVMGRIVADYQGEPFPQIFLAYERQFNAVLSRMPRKSSVINVLLHAFGYVSNSLLPRERELFLDSLEKYRYGAVPLSACTILLKSWIHRFNQYYLTGQTFFEPYPEEITRLIHEGNGKMANSLEKTS